MGLASFFITTPPPMRNSAHNGLSAFVDRHMLHRHLLLPQPAWRFRWAERPREVYQDRKLAVGPSGPKMLNGAAERAKDVMLNKEFSLNNPTFLRGA